MMYYKGTPCQWVLSDRSKVEIIRKLSEMMIEAGLKIGVSLKEQSSNYKKQMDHMEQKMVDSEKKSKNGLPKIGVLSQHEMVLWWLNMFALIRLKVIKDDNMNGLLDMCFNTTAK